MKRLPFFFLLCFAIGCRTAQPVVDVADATVIQTADFSIDLTDLKTQNTFPKTEVFVSINDPVYHKNKRFNAFPLQTLFNKHWNFDEIEINEMKIVFECEDGYKPEMPLSKFLSVNSYLAISDADAPDRRSWEQVMKNGNEMIIEPFLLFYDNEVTPDDKSFKRPYNLVKIHLESVASNELSSPKEITALAGYKLFNTHCKTCHAINGIGGTMGPELNFPKSVTEYWKTNDLVAFIVNPLAYRNKVKMPVLGITTEQSKEIVMYLEYVQGRKE
jgi:cytochrome c2